MSNEIAFSVSAMCFMLLFVVLCADLYVMYGIRNALFHMLEDILDEEENDEEENENETEK